MNFKLKNIAIFGILLLSLIWTHTLYADIATITVSPVTKSIVFSKGETKKVTFTVYNNSDEIQYVYVEPRPWHMVDENKSVLLSSWLKATPDEFEIEPKKKKKVAFNVTAPDKAVGELAAMIAFRPEPKEGQAVNVVFSVSLYARIKDTEKVDYKISDFRLWNIEDRDALGAKVALKNLGNIHLKPRIAVFIQNISNKNLNKASLRYGKPAYPGKIQDYYGAIYNFKLKPGLYKAMIDTEYTNIAKRFRRKIFFTVGKDGKILFTFFRRPKR